MTAIEKRLDEAEGAMADAPHTWDRLKDWWTGAPITAAWGSVHQAEADMVLVERKEDVRANLPWLLAWIQSAMESGYRRSWHEKRLKAQIEGGALDLTAIRQAFKDVIVANTDRYSNLRAFRNTLVLVTAMLAALVAALAIWHLLNRDFLSLCTSTGPKAERCLSGERSRPVDVALVALVGAVGGLLAIAFGLSKTEVAPSRYDPKAWQALLKPVAGAATALAGILMVQADVLIAPANSRSESLLLSYAVVFGFSQQLFTRFVDKRAETLIGTDGKEST